MFLDTAVGFVGEIFENKLPDGVNSNYIDKIKHIVSLSIKFLSQEDAIKNIGQLIFHNYLTLTHIVHVFTHTMAFLLDRQIFKRKMTLWK